MAPRAAHRAIVPYLGLVGFAGALVFIMNALRPLPFGSTDDGPIYFLPLIKAQTDAWLSGHFLAIDWRLGCGWTPWEGIQAGAFYPPYLLANLCARLMGRPLALLDVSAAIHLALSGVLAYALTAGRLDRLRRLLWSCLAVAQPAPIAIGMNWHNYLASYPWFIGLLLLLWRVAQGYSAWTRRNRLLLILFVWLFFLSAHPQMFVIGIALLFAWRLALGGGRGCLRDGMALAVVLLSCIVPLLFIYRQALLATPDWFSEREAHAYLLSRAQSLSTWLTGLGFGNLIRTHQFALWPGVSWTGIGMFFCPLLMVSGCLALGQRNWVWCALVAGLGVLLSARSFPWVAWLGAGPFAGFRWTWKLSIYTAALAWAMTLAQTERGRVSRKGLTWALTLLVMVTTVVSFRTIPFDLFPAGTASPGRNIADTCSETRALMRAWGILPGERIAWVGKGRISMPTLAAPLHGLLGNAPLLVGLQSAHLYEPLENRFAALAHDGYSTPWRITVEQEHYTADPCRYDRRFEELGVTWLVSTFSEAFPPASRRSYQDRNGQSLYGRRLPSAASGLSFPWGVGADGSRVALVVAPGGALRTATALPLPPDVRVGRPLKWKQLPSGHWYGVAQLVETSWGLAVVLGCLVSIGLLFHKRLGMPRWT